MPQHWGGGGLPSVALTRFWSFRCYPKLQMVVGGENPKAVLFFLQGFFCMGLCTYQSCSVLYVSVCRFVKMAGKPYHYLSKQSKSLQGRKMTLPACLCPLDFKKKRRGGWSKYFCALLYFCIVVGLLGPFVKNEQLGYKEKKFSIQKK